MKEIKPNEYGVFMDPEIIENFSDKIIRYTIKKAVYKNEEYFASSAWIDGYGVWAGMSGPVTINFKSSYEREIESIKNFLTTNFKYSEPGEKHLKKMKIFQTEQQLSLF